jgi:hypothetical protein
MGRIGDIAKKGLEKLGHPSDDVMLDKLRKDMQPNKLDELDEIARLAGLHMDEESRGEYIDDKKADAKAHGQHTAHAFGQDFAVDESNLNEAQCNECGMYEIQCSCHEGNLFTNYLKNTPKGGQFEIDGKTYTDTSNLDEEPNEGNAYGLAVQQTPPGEEIKIHGKPTGDIKRENAELNELARLAGLQIQEMHDDDYSDDSDMAGEEETTPGGNTYTYVFDENNNTTKFTYTDANGQSQSFEIYYDSTARGFDPHEVHDSTDPKHQTAALGNQIITHDDMPDVIDRLIAAPTGVNEADAPVTEPDEEPINNAHKGKYQSMKGSTMGPGEGDAGEKRMFPPHPAGDNGMTEPSRKMPIKNGVKESALQLEARLAAEYESIKKQAR